jgi:secondary thiamine-phosphate synthase enzyme
MALRIATDTIWLRTRGFCDVCDLTAQVAERVCQRGLREGSVLLFVNGATGALTTIEFEPGAVADLKAAIERLVPRDRGYAHDATWGDANGFAHVRAALLKPGLEVPVAAGRLMLGTWQQVVLCDFDNHPRERSIICQLRGEFAPEVAAR